MWNLLIYANAAGSLYILVRGWQALEILGRKRIWFAAMLLVAALSFAAVRMRIVSGALYDVCYVVGYLWLVVVLYGFLILFIIDTLRIIARIGNIKPVFIYRNYPRSKAIMFGAVCLALSAVLTTGYFNSFRPRATHVTIPIEKQAGHLTTLRVALVSDIHLGQVYGRKALARIVKTINKHHPDMVVLVGDIFDGNLEPVIKNDMGAEFTRLQAPYGAYFANGNHERYGGERGQIAVDYLVSHGIKPLLDTVVLIDSSFYLAGRIDRSSRTRKPVSELLQDIDSRLPVILLDHQPYNLEEAEQAGVDLQLSGHTHHGQLFPLNYITGKIYEQDWGFLQKGTTKYYISCGAGTWGPPVRTTGYPEVVIVEVAFGR
jgi:predicted MPP superfamily phosphohydrolase